MIKRQRLQDITYEKVQSRMRDHFMTVTGKVIEGNYDIGDTAPVIFDRASLRYLPVYKKKEGRRIKTAEAGVKASSRPIKACKIYIYDLPEEVAPMANAGTITEDEVEGIDYFKTYYKVFIKAHPECKKSETGKCLLDFNVCDTGEVEDCTPFYYDIPPGVPYKEGDIKQHCINSTSFCQGEIFEFAEDEGGTYFTWKAYTEYPPDKQDGLGYMLFKGFIPVEGKDPPEEVCASNLYIVKVNCCYKYSDAYKAFHPELEDLDIEYTSLVMGCDETQELTAKNGCPPYSWSLISGGGVLTPAEGNLAAVYESPELNPNCVDNPTIKLEDRCENSKELKLAVSCYEPPYVALVWGDINDCSGHGCAFHGGSWYFCHYNMILRRRNYSCNGVLQDSYHWKDYEFAQCVGASSFDCGELVEHNYFLCGGPPPNCIEFTGNCNDCTNYWSQVCGNCDLGLSDRRTEEVKAGGCCPINPETGLPY